MDETKPGQLDDLVKQQAKKSGISQKDAAKALKKLKKGGMMAQIAPQLQEQFMAMNPNLTPREKLRQKIQSKQAGRTKKVTKAINYEKQREDIAVRKEKEAAQKIEKEEQAKRKVRNHKKKIKDLEKKLGTIADDLYYECLQKTQTGELLAGERNRCNNIMELYSKQQEFKNKIDMDDDLADFV